MLPADLNAKACLRRFEKRRWTPLAGVRVSYHGDAAASLEGKNEAGFGTIEQNEPLRIAQFLRRDAFVRLELHLFELEHQLANAVVQLRAFNRERRKRQSQKHQSCYERFHRKIIAQE